MTGVCGGFSLETEDNASDLSRGPGPEEAQTVEECKFNFHDLHALQTARFVFRNSGLERKDMWKIMILIMTFGKIRAKICGDLCYHIKTHIHRTVLCNVSIHRANIYKTI